jgi:lipopolysaccharide/colanic/teichoic acid biosynthesis glycosyltransferase
MYKFRSMSTDAEKQWAALEQQNESADGVLFKIKADPRITRVGRIIRRLSIDELPQLLNIVKGDMFIVGPRPAIPGEVDQYDLQARKRLQAKPGLTCLRQISGRSELSFSQQVDLDIRYLQSRSLTEDLKIIALTVPAVFDLHGNFWQVRDPSIIGRPRSNQESKIGLPEESLSEVERRQVDAALSNSDRRKLNFFKRFSQG